MNEDVKQEQVTTETVGGICLTVTWSKCRNGVYEAEITENLQGKVAA